MHPNNKKNHIGLDIGLPSLYGHNSIPSIPFLPEKGDVNHKEQKKIKNGEELRSKLINLDYSKVRDKKKQPDLDLTNYVPLQITKGIFNYASIRGESILSESETPPK